MEDLQSKLSALMSDPDIMQKVGAMASQLNLGNLTSATSQAVHNEPQKQVLPGLDPGMLQKLAGLTTLSGVDKNQLSLLRALGPYLSTERISKLERAMQAAAMAKTAVTFLGSAHHSRTGR